VKVAVCYVMPTTMVNKFAPMARRFAETYMLNPPGKTDHEVHVALNGTVPPGPWTEQLFNPLPVTYHQHNNAGKDIGAYQALADELDADLMVCMGTPIHFHKTGWLDRMVWAVEEYGPAVYGPWGFKFPLPHLRTTCFWTAPEFLNSYPHRVTDGGRYAFEHGPGNISLWTQQMGYEPRMVTWTECLEMKDWDGITKEESLVIDQHLSGER
jgi:hypothetical protein